MSDAATPGAPAPGPPTTSVRSLHVLDFGLFEVDARHGGGRTIGIPGYLIRTDDHAILVDGGFPRRYAEDAEAAAAADGLGSFGRVVELTERNLPPQQLELLGLTTDDVTLVVLTHGDIDHVGALERFAEEYPNATLVVAAMERALDRPRYFGDARPVAWPESVPELRVEGDTELAPGVDLLLAPGHSPGQLALLVRLPATGPVLLAGDAISRPTEFEEGFGGAWDEGAAEVSARRLLGIAEREGAWVVYGHDPEQWSELRKAPDGYA